MKKQNGITLIALIITIIVMLILVGVTINVALNGGLFSTADEATRKTEKHAIYDQIVGAMEVKNNGYFNVAGTYEEVVNIFGEDKVKPTNPGPADENTKEVTFEVTGKRGTYTYKITETEIIIDPPQEDPIITALNKFKNQSAMTALGSYDTEKACYRFNSTLPGLENLQDLEIYVSNGYSVIRDPNTGKDYILKIDNNSNMSEIILQPEEKITTIRDGIVALSNLEDFSLGAIKDGYWFGGLDPKSLINPDDNPDENMKIYCQGFENSDINSIILSNVDYFNSLDDSMSIEGLLGVEYIYVPVGFEQTIWADYPKNVQFTFGGKDAGDVDSLSKIEIDGQQYYELHWSELESK